MKFLAKFREFKTGMDPIDYLATEMRQNFRALETFFQETSTEMARLNSRLVFLFNSPEEVTNTTVIYTLSQSTFVALDGKVVDNFYYPSVTGKYFIEYNATFANIRANNVPPGNMNLFAVRSDNGEPSGNGSISYSVANNFVTNNPARVGFFADLSPNLGIGFKGMSDANGLIIQNLNAKITKVG